MAVLKYHNGTSWVPVGQSNAPTIATSAEAIEGTDNTKLMTPLRTKEAILSFGGGGSSEDIPKQSINYDDCYKYTPSGEAWPEVNIDGINFIKTPAIAHSQVASLDYTFPRDGNYYTIYYKVSSEVGYDKLRITFKGQTVDEVSGQFNNNQIRQFVIQTNTTTEDETLYMEYKKDSSGSLGEDCAYLAIVPGEFNRQAKSSDFLHAANGNIHITESERNKISLVNENNMLKGTGSFTNRNTTTNTASGSYSTALGYYVNATTSYSAIFGKYGATNSDTLFAVGNGTSTSNRALAFEVKNTGQTIVNNLKIGGFSVSHNTSNNSLDFSI